MICEVCGRKFKKKRSLSNHQRVHDIMKHYEKKGIIKLPILLKPDRAKVYSENSRVPDVVWKNDFKDTPNYIAFWNESILNAFGTFEFLISEVDDLELIQTAKHVIGNILQLLNE